MKLLKRLPAAVRYICHGELPPDPASEAQVVYWLTLGHTGDYNQASAVRTATLAGSTR